MRSIFDTVASEYDSGRPSYPDELYEKVEELSGTRLPGAVVLDVGAGTGISTRGMLARSAVVIAVDLGPQMISRLRAHTPGTRAVQGDGNALPFRADIADLVTYAQAWHWTDPSRSLADADRVLKPGGALAIWWNAHDLDAAAWISEHRYASPKTRAAIAAATKYGFDVRSTEVLWSRTVTIEVFLTALRSRSYVARLDGAEADALIERERSELSARFPDGELNEPFVTHLIVARKVR